MSATTDRRGLGIDALDADAAPEVMRALSRLAGREVAGLPIDVQMLKRNGKVWRASVAADGTVYSLILKRLTLPEAHCNARVAGRWLPAIGLGDTPPAVLGGVAPSGASWAWQLYEDVGVATLQDEQAMPGRVKVAVERIAEFHVRGAGHPLVCECRREGEDFGMHYFLTNVGDARRLLELLRGHGPAHEGLSEVCDRLRRHLDTLLDSAPRRGRLLAEAGGPETMLHGDLWTTNVVVQGGATPRVRLIDWDHAGAGPVTYDLSTFLLRFPDEDRRAVLGRYRDALCQAGGWQLPGDAELNVLFETAEYARYASRILWPAIALLQENAEWGVEELQEVARWFEALTPVIPGEASPCRI